MKIVSRLLKSFLIPRTTRKSVKVEISDRIKLNLQKYEETYKLLGEYDKKHIENPEVLADPGRLRNAIRGLQRSPNKRGVNSSV